MSVTITMVTPCRTAYSDGRLSDELHHQAAFDQRRDLLDELADARRRAAISATPRPRESAP